MGRGKIEIKRIENSSNRQVTYSKRRNGILKKAKEITVLCDAHLSLIIFSSSGKMHDYCSPSASLVDILEKYHTHSGKKLWDAKHENLSNEIDRIKKENDNMQIELRHLKGEDITSLHHKELMDIEQTLENGAASIRDRQAEIMKMHRKNREGLWDPTPGTHRLLISLCKHRMVEEEHKYLVDELHRREMAMEANARGLANDGYNSQVPFAFRVQPIQPNLQDRM